MLALLNVNPPASPMLVRIQVLGDWSCSAPYNKDCSLEAIKDMLVRLCYGGLVENLGDSQRYRLTLLGERIANRLKSENK